MTSAGIEPATFRFVAQHLNHCATAIPIQVSINLWKFNGNGLQTLLNTATRDFSSHFLLSLAPCSVACSSRYIASDTQLADDVFSLRALLITCHCDSVCTEPHTVTGRKTKQYYQGFPSILSCLCHSGVARAAECHYGRNTCFKILFAATSNGVCGCFFLCYFSEMF